MARRLVVLAPLGVVFAGCDPAAVDMPINTDHTDRDGDGIVDTEELDMETDPTNDDSDGDAWKDGVELDGNTDPTDADDHPYTGGWPIDSCRYDVESSGSGVGEIAPAFALGDQFGDTVSLHDFCGKAVLVVAAAFW